MEPTFWAFITGAAFFILCIGGAIGLIISFLVFVEWAKDEYKYSQHISMTWDQTLNSMLDAGLPVTEPKDRPRYSEYGTFIGGVKISVEAETYGMEYAKSMACTRATQKRLRDYVQRSYCIDILKKAEQEQNRETV
jgi:hypothetical protein